MSDSLWLHGLQHARPPCPPTPGVYSNSCPLTVMPSNHLILCHPLLLPSNLSQHQDLFKSVLRIRWPNFWSFSFSISPSIEYWGLISFRMDWLDLLAVQVTPKRLLQHCSAKASILWRSALFMAQLSPPYRTTGKTIALTIRTFVSKRCVCFLICSL